MSDTATPDTTLDNAALSSTSVSYKPTSYVVLQKDDDGWISNGTFDARDAESAIRAAIDGEMNPDGTFVAIPARSWKPVKVTAKVETTLELKPAS